MFRLSAAALVALTSAGLANAWFRVQCQAPLVSERLDPIISPGATPSAHVHTVNGGSNFGPSSTFDTLRTSSCSNCNIVQDNSAYWYPKLYFKDPVNGTLTAVQNGKLLVYYQNRGAGDVLSGGTGLKAFPPGLRMVSGNPFRRSRKYERGLGTQAELAERAVAWTCLRYTAGLQQTDDNGNGFPTTNCETAFQSRIHMPACWDGKNLDSANHVDHVAYLSRLDQGTCPPTHPIYMMKMFYEVTWDVHLFANRWNATKGDKWPFVWSHGDPTGYGWHGDFQNGWDVTALQNAIDKCNNPNDQTGQGIAAACPYFGIRAGTAAAACKKTPQTSENVSGPFKALPGCNPLQYGPADAKFYSGLNCPVTASSNTGSMNPTRP